MACVVSLFDFISAHSWLKGALYFSLKNVSFKFNFCAFFIDISVFLENFFFQFSSIKIHSMGCYLYVGETFSTIFNYDTKSIFHLIL